MLAAAKNSSAFFSALLSAAALLLLCCCCSVVSERSLAADQRTMSSGWKKNRIDHWFKAQVGLDNGRHLTN